jgi:hypothetical protein
MFRPISMNFMPSLALPPTSLKAWKLRQVISFCLNATMFMASKDVTPEVSAWFKGIIEDIDSKTVGTLLRHFKKTGTMDDSIITIVDEALEKRNYLTHRFFRSHNFAIHSEEGRREMIGIHPVSDAARPLRLRLRLRIS